MRLLSFLMLALLLMAGGAFGYDLLLIQSTHNPAYADIMAGFRSACPSDSRTVIVSDYTDLDLQRIVREERPRLVVALGDEALALAEKLRQTPVLALMTLGIHAPRSPRPNLAGIDLFVPPESYIPLFSALKAKRVGLIHNPAKTSWYVNRAITAAGRSGITLEVRQVRDPRETVSMLAGLKGKVDAVWMIPDTTAVVRETLEAYFVFSLEQRVPVVSFTAAHLQRGAAAVVDIDRMGLGRQAGEMAAGLLGGTSPADLSVVNPRTTGVKTNPAVLRNLGLPRLQSDRLALYRESAQ